MDEHEYPYLHLRHWSNQEPSVNCWHPLRHTLALPEAVRDNFPDHQGVRVVAKYPTKSTDFERIGPEEYDVVEHAEWLPSEFRLYLVPNKGSGTHRFVAEVEGPLYTHGDHNVLYQHVRDTIVPSLLEILSTDSGK